MMSFRPCHLIFLLAVTTSVCSQFSGSVVRAEEPIDSKNAATNAPSSALGSPLLDGVTHLQDFQRRRESSSAEDLNANGDARGIEVGETLFLGDLEGPGTITHIWTTVGSLDPFHGSSLVLRIYYDGNEKPSVEAPLGDFFGVGHGALSSYESLPVAVSSEGRARNCYWRMPFRKRAKVTVTNESKTYRTGSFYYYLDWEKQRSLPDDTAYFHAQYRQAMPAQPGNYTILETTGRGHYVGTVYSAHQTKVGWFGEGDDQISIDGEKRPSLLGTGTEDYFCDAWGFRKFSTPFHGVSLWEGYYAGDRVTAYRWHLTDPIPFQKSLRFEIEHKGSIFNEATGIQTGSFLDRPDWISSVAFWYQYPAATFEVLIPPAEKRIAPYRVLKASELESQTTPVTTLLKQEQRVNYVPGQGDGELAFDFQLTEAGTYQINAFLVFSVFGSRYQPFLDDKPLGQELDLCRSGADSLWVSFDLHKLEKGKHTLKFVGKGVSPQKRSLAPPFFALAMDYLILLRLEDMEGYNATAPKKEEK